MKWLHLLTLHIVDLGQKYQIFIILYKTRKNDKLGEDQLPGLIFADTKYQKEPAKYI